MPTLPLLRQALQLVSPSGPRAKLQIFIFHRVLTQTDPLVPGEVDAQRFDRLCGWLARWFNVMRLDDAVRALRAGSLPARAAAITFDDGYADNLDVAVPILRRHGLSAAFFIATGYLDGGQMWNDDILESVRHAAGGSLHLQDTALHALGTVALPDLAAQRQAVRHLLGAAKYLDPAVRQAVADTLRQQSGLPVASGPMLSSDGVRALVRAGMVVGAHTVTHPILARVSLQQARDEMDRSRQHLEALLNLPVCLFAYPNGCPNRDYHAVHAGLAAELGFEAAVTTAPGVAAHGDDPYQLPRFTPWSQQPASFGLQLARNVFSGRPQLVADSCRAAA